MNHVQHDLEMNEAHQEYRKLLEKASALVDLVDGARSVRWSHDGLRLKDTGAWAEFYVAVRGFKS